MPEDIAMGIFPPPAKLLSRYRLPLWYINVSHILLRLFIIFWNYVRKTPDAQETGVRLRGGGAELDSQGSSSIKETIRIMKEIDETVDEHGGWHVQYR